MKKTSSMLMIVASAVMFGVAPSLTRYAYDYGGNWINIQFYMSLITLPFFLLLLKWEGAGMGVDRKTLLKMAILTFAGSGTAGMMLISSYALIPVGMATTLHFVYPVVVAFGLVLFFREKLNAIKLAALAVAVAGIACTSMEGGGINPVGLALALGSGVVWAFYIVYLDKSGLSALSPYLVGLYCSLFTILQSGLIGLATGNLAPFTSYQGWIAALGATLLVRVVGMSLFQLGVRGAGSLAAGILSTFEPITSVIVGILFLSEGATVGKLVGCVLVVSGVCLVVYSDYREAAVAGAEDDVELL